MRTCVHAIIHTCGRACTRVRACVRACSRACVLACVHVCVRACVRACVHACNTLAYLDEIDRTNKVVFIVGDRLTNRLAHGFQALYIHTMCVCAFEFFFLISRLPSDK